MTADLDHARAYVKRRWVTRKGLLDACHVLANFGDTDDRILARELRNVLWGTQASDLTPTGKALARVNARKMRFQKLAEDAESVVLITTAIAVTCWALLVWFDPEIAAAWVR